MKRKTLAITAGASTAGGLLVLTLARLWPVIRDRFAGRDLLLTVARSRLGRIIIEASAGANDQWPPESWRFDTGGKKSAKD